MRERPCLIASLHLWFYCLWVWFWWAGQAITGQSLVDLARQERLRREGVGPVVHRIDNTGQSAPVISPAGNQDKRGKPPSAGTDKEVGKLQETLAAQGLRVRRQLLQARADLESLEREAARLERLPPAMIRPGRVTRNPDLESIRRKTAIARKHLNELEEAWRGLQDQARRAGLPPGVLRGQ